MSSTFSNGIASSAPALDDIVNLPAPRQAPTFRVDDWDVRNEPLGITSLRNGESFLDGVQRLSEKINTAAESKETISSVSKGCHSFLPGMRVADDQVGIILKNGAVQLRPPGAYRTTVLNPWKKRGAVVPIRREAGVEFNPIVAASRVNRKIAKLNLGQSFRQVVLQKQQVAVFEDQTSTRLVGRGTYVYCSGTVMRGVIDLNRMRPVVVERETEDTVAVSATEPSQTRTDHHGRQAPAQQGHGTMVGTMARYIPAGYTASVAGITIARPEKGFVVLHKDAQNCISMTEGICATSGTEDFVRRAKVDRGGTMTLDDLEIEFGDMNHYAKSTPMLEVKSKDNLDALCRAQIKWKQARPDVWVAHRGAFTDPFDMLEEKCANMMRDWLLSVKYLEALEEKSNGFTKVEHQWSSELNDAGRAYGVEVLGLEITTLRFPNIDKQDEKVALQLAETNLQIEMSRQNALKENETSKLNQATHQRMQEDKDRYAQAEERQQEVQRRKNAAEAETVARKAEMDTLTVKAERELALARENKEKEVQLAKTSAEAGAERVRAEGKRDAAQLEAEGEIAATKEKNKAQLDFLERQATLLKSNPGLVDLLKIQNDLLKTEALAMAARTNPNVVLMPGQEGLEARRMNNGHPPQVPGSAIISA